MKTELEDAILKTVMFWSDKSFRAAFNQNNGDDSPSGGLAFMLMNMNSLNAQKSVTDEKVKVFENILAEKLRTAANQGNWYHMTLDVDYHPCQLLYESAIESNLDPNCFPCKTFTRINKDFSVDAKYQYRGNLVKL